MTENLKWYVLLVALLPILVCLCGITTMIMIRFRRVLRYATTNHLINRQSADLRVLLVLFKEAVGLTMADIIRMSVSASGKIAARYLAIKKWLLSSIQFIIVVIILLSFAFLVVMSPILIGMMLRNSLKELKFGPGCP